MLFPLDFLVGHQSWWTIDYLKTLFEMAALVAALLFFIYKVIAGYLITGMALTISCKRAHGSPGHDHLAVVATLKKGKTGTLRLHDARARIISFGTAPHIPPRTQIKEMIGVERLAFVKDKPKWPWIKTIWSWNIRRKIDWAVSKSNQFLNLAPGDQAQFACVCDVPSSEPATVEVVVLAWRWFSVKKSQWRSSTISLPIPPP